MRRAVEQLRFDILRVVTNEVTVDSFLLWRSTENYGYGPGWGMDIGFKIRRDRGDWRLHWGDW